MIFFRKKIKKSVDKNKKGIYSAIHLRNGASVKRYLKIQREGKKEELETTQERAVRF